MASTSPPRQCSRGPKNAIHVAAGRGSVERIVALLAIGAYDIDQGDAHGRTPLMMASFLGHSRIVRTLLRKGADVSLVDEDGATALFVAAHRGHVAITKMLVKAGADLGVVTWLGGQKGSPLHLAAEEGHSEVMSVLIEAGANPNSRLLGGVTPLFLAAAEGQLDAIKVLLRAKANPLLARDPLKPGMECVPSDHDLEVTCVPLEVAARNGHWEVVRELIRKVGIEGCGGESGGVNALCTAAMRQDLGVMAMFTDAGVVDTGEALVVAAGEGCEATVEYLLQQAKEKLGAYVNFREPSSGRTPLFSVIAFSPSPRVARILIDAGADTASAVRITDREGTAFFDDTLLAITNITLRDKMVRGEDATEEQLNGLKLIRRLLLRVEAVHSTSWLWPSETPFVAFAVESARNNKTVSTPLRKMLPLLRGRAERRCGVPLTTLVRYLIRG